MKKWHAQRTSHRNKRILQVYNNNNNKNSTVERNIIYFSRRRDLTPIKRCHDRFLSSSVLLFFLFLLFQRDTLENILFSHGTRIVTSSSRRGVVRRIPQIARRTMKEKKEMEQNIAYSSANTLVQ